METVLSSLGFGTRYCVVSADHDQPEMYSDDNERAPQTAIERITDFGGVYDKFSRTTHDSPNLLDRLRNEVSSLKTVDFGKSLEAGGRQLFDRVVRREDVVKTSILDCSLEDGDKENASPPSAASASDAGVLSLFDKLAMRHHNAELAAFDKSFPIRRPESGGGGAPLMSGDPGNNGQDWGWDSANSSTKSGGMSSDLQWGSGAAWEDAHLAAPLTKAAKSRGASNSSKKSTNVSSAPAASSVKSSASDEASLIDLDGSGKDQWKSWEDDAWDSLTRKG